MELLNCSSSFLSMKKLNHDKLDSIVLHCTGNDKDTVQSITAYHKQLGWETCGYNYVIDRFGNVIQPRGDKYIGAHCRGHNSHTIGVAFIGASITSLQMDALVSLLYLLLSFYPQITKIYPHNFFNQNKTCPNFCESDFIDLKERFNSNSENQEILLFYSKHNNYYKVYR